MARKRHVLIVEDDAFLANGLMRMLELEGCDVRVADSAHRAMAEVLADRPDLVVLDIGLPDTDGYEVCKRLRALSRPWRIPVLMLTGYCRPVEKLRGYACGADAYLTKPCEEAELKVAVRQLLETPI